MIDEKRTLSIFAIVAFSVAIGYMLGGFFSVKIILSNPELSLDTLSNSYLFVLAVLTALFTAILIIKNRNKKNQIINPLGFPP